MSASQEVSPDPTAAPAREALSLPESLVTVLEAMHDGVVIHDCHGAIRYANSAAERVLGLTMDQMTGLTPIDPRWAAVHEDGTEFPGDAHPAAITLATGEPQTDVVMGIMKPDGSRTWISVNSRLLTLSGEEPLSSVLATFANVTNLKAAEIRRAAQLDAAIESMADAVFISDTNGNFIEFNEAFATFHKFTDKAQCATTLLEYPEFLDVFMESGELAPLEMWAVPRALRGETGRSVEYRLERKDTGETWIGSYSFAPIHDETGTIIGSVVIGRDITEQKHNERKLEELNRFLEFRVEDRTRDLAEALQISERERNRRA